MSELQQCIILEGRTKTSATLERELQTKLEERRQQEEILWCQKSQIRWLKEGERNTKFFRRSIVQRWMHNNIAFLDNGQGERMENTEDIEK